VLGGKEGSKGAEIIRIIRNNALSSSPAAVRLITVENGLQKINARSNKDVSSRRGEQRTKLQQQTKSLGSSTSPLHLRNNGLSVKLNKGKNPSDCCCWRKDFLSRVLLCSKNESGILSGGADDGMRCLWLRSSILPFPFTTQ